jgi:hypothetical protein
MYFSFTSYCTFVSISFSVIFLQAPDQWVGICYSDETGLLGVSWSARDEKLYE